jgi:hypothetical protein
MYYLLAGISLFTGFVIALFLPAVGLATGPRRLSFNALDTVFSARFWLLAIGIFDALVLITQKSS